MNDSAYEMQEGSLETILSEFVLNLKYTFGSTVKYVGTTTQTKTSLRRIRDIDLAIVFEQVNESQVSYVWKIINRLHGKYSIFLDTRIYSSKQLAAIPLINKYLLSLFLKDLLGENPFKGLSPEEDILKKECLQRIQEQENRIVTVMPRIAGDLRQLRAIGQSVYDAIRAYLILESHPIASKEEARVYFEQNHPRFKEVSAIYGGYLDPNSIVNIGNYVVDSLAVVKHLLYKAQNKSLVDEVLLINTPSSIMPHPQDNYLSYDHNMPLGLVCVGSYLKERGYKVRIIDSYAENFGALSTVDQIWRESNVPRIIGFNCSSPNVHVVHKMATYLKRIRKDLTLVCGGPHASLATEHTLSTGDIDYAVVGEGEVPFANLVKAVFESHDRSKFPGVFSSKSGVLSGQENTVPLNLSTLPCPELNLLPLNRYFAVKKRIYIHTSRGCAFNCIYCSVPKFWVKPVREIPLEVLRSQISKLLELYKPDEVQIVDDNFSHHKGKLIKSFCEITMNEGWRIKWKCQVRADQLDMDAVKMMAQAGCFEVDLGIESGSKEIQKYIRKNLDLGKTLEVISAIHEHKIFTKAFFMLGFPEENYNQIEDTINYAVELKKRGLDDVAFFPVMPFPGTEISHITKKTVFQGAIIDDVDIYERSFAGHRLRKYSAKPEISLNSQFTPEELRLLVKFAYQQFSYGASVENLEDKFRSFVQAEESILYGV